MLCGGLGTARWDSSSEEAGGAQCVAQCWYYFSTHGYVDYSAPMGTALARIHQHIHHMHAQGCGGERRRTVCGGPAMALTQLGMGQAVSMETEGLVVIPEMVTMWKMTFHFDSSEGWKEIRV